MGFTLKPIISSGAPESARTLFWEVFLLPEGEVSIWLPIFRGWRMMKMCLALNS